MYTAAIPPFGAVTATDVAYSATPGYPAGTDDVQEALDYLITVAGSVAEMTPTAAGTAFGSQSSAKSLESLGRGVSVAVATNAAMARYNASVSGTPQPALYQNCIFDVNRSSQNGATSVQNGLSIINETGIGTSVQTASTVLANTSTLTGTDVSNSAIVLNTTGVGGGSSVLDSVGIANSSSLNSCVLDRTALLTTRFNGPGLDLTGSTVVGDATNAVFSSARNAAFIASGETAVVTVNGAESLYIGNQTAAETVGTREAYISRYDRFFLRTLPLDNTSGQVCYYEPSTGELTYGPEIPAYILPAKLPTILGGSHGIISSARGNEVTGINSFNNYSTSPPQLSGVTAIGSGLYTGSAPPVNGFLDSIFLGRSHQLPAATIVQNSLIAANAYGPPNIISMTDCCMVVPRGGALLMNYSGVANGASFHSSGSVTCTVNPNYATVLSSGGTVNPGATNLVLASTIPGSSATMAGTGNTLITSATAANTVTWPAGVNNSTLIRSGIANVVPSASDQFAINHGQFYAPSLASTTTASNVTLPVIFDQALGRLIPISSANFSRTLRRSGTTDAAGQIVFATNPITPPADAGFNIVIVNASTTINYTGHVIAVGVSSVTVQVFQAVNAIVGSPTSIPVGAGIVVRLSMHY